MKEYIKVLFNKKEYYLNDLLVDLGDTYVKNIFVEVEGIKFELLPEVARDFIEEYGRDQFGQEAVRAAKSLKTMRHCEYACGFVKEVK